MAERKTEFNITFVDGGKESSVALEATNPIAKRYPFGDSFSLDDIEKKKKEKAHIPQALFIIEFEGSTKRAYYYPTDYADRIEKLKAIRDVFAPPEKLSLYSSAHDILILCVSANVEIPNNIHLALLALLFSHTKITIKYQSNPQTSFPNFLPFIDIIKNPSGVTYQPNQIVATHVKMRERQPVYSVCGVSDIQSIVSFRDKLMEYTNESVKSVLTIKGLFGLIKGSIEYSTNTKFFNNTLGKLPIPNTKDHIKEIDLILDVLCRENKDGDRLIDPIFTEPPVVSLCHLRQLLERVKPGETELDAGSLQHKLHQKAHPGSFLSMISRASAGYQFLIMDAVREKMMATHKNTLFQDIKTLAITDLEYFYPRLRKSLAIELPVDRPKRSLFFDEYDPKSSRKLPKAIQLQYAILIEDTDPLRAISIRTHANARGLQQDKLSELDVNILKTYESLEARFQELNRIYDLVAAIRSSKWLKYVAGNFEIPFISKGSPEHFEPCGALSLPVIKEILETAQHIAHAALSIPEGYKKIQEILNKALKESSTKDDVTTIEFYRIASEIFNAHTQAYEEEKEMDTKQENLA